MLHCGLCPWMVWEIREGKGACYRLDGMGDGKKKPVRVGRISSLDSTYSNYKIKPSFISKTSSSFNIHWILTFSVRLDFYVWCLLKADAHPELTGSWLHITWSGWYSLLISRQLSRAYKSSTFSPLAFLGYSIEWLPQQYTHTLRHVGHLYLSLSLFFFFFAKI